MRKMLIPAMAIAALAVAGCGSDDNSGGGGGGYGNAAPKTTTSTPAASTSTPAAAPAGAAKDAVDVAISNFKFVPPSVSVTKGGSITWMNKDSAAHTATLDQGDGAFDTGTLNQGDSKKLTFSTPGTFAYICSFHPFMKGTVVVE
jgi:plastocyanin